MPPNSSTAEAPTAADTTQLVHRRAALRAFFWGRSLEECIESGRDNILQLRLVAALLVIFGHSCLTGSSVIQYDPVYALLPRMLGHLAGLCAFFLISGMLITLSWHRRPDVPRFIRARFLRIWPAFAACMLLWAFVFGPLVSELSLGAYFSPARPENPYMFALRGLTIVGATNVLPGVFGHAPVAPGALDSPTWSIRVELMLYGWVAAAGVLRLLRLPWLASAAIAALFSWLILWPMSHDAFDPLLNESLLVQGFFGAGAILCLLRRHVRVSSGIMLLVAIAAAIANRTTHILPFTLLAITYFVLWFAYVPKLPAIPRNADLSYGTYLWGWPVQQSVIALAHVKSGLVLFAIAAPIAMLCGTLSWFYVERPALQLKDVRFADFMGLGEIFRRPAAQT